jgi:hypothetical protein
MHKQVSALVSAGGSPGKLAIFGAALGAADLDIATTGGAEWLHDGPITLILKDDGAEAMQRFAVVCHEHHVPWLSFAIVAVRLSNEKGQLGRAAAAVGDDINIYSVLVLESSETTARVGLGIRRKQADEVVLRLNTADPTFKAEVLENPDEPDDGILWDQRTEDLLPLWDDPNTKPDDPAFWQLPSAS